MTSKGTLWGWGILGCATVTACIGSLLANSRAETEQQADNDVLVATLIPAKPVLYLSWDGDAAHAESLKKTVAYQAFHESGLMEYLTKSAVQLLTSSTGGDPKPLVELFHTITENGFSLAAWGEPLENKIQPSLLAVLHNSSSLEPTLAKYIKRGTTETSINLGSKTIHGRKVHFIRLSLVHDLEFSWWTEGDHLLIGAGLKFSEQLVNIAAGKSPNLTTNPLWKKHQQVKPDFEQNVVAWLAMDRLQAAMAEQTVPRQFGGAVQWKELFKITGLDTLKSLVIKSGCKDSALWTETIIDAPGERTGLLAVKSPKPLSLNDLPPLPVSTPAFAAVSLDWSSLYTTLTKTIEQVVAQGPPETATRWDELKKAATKKIGFDPKTGIIDSIGNVVCVYGDTNQAPFGLGTGIAVRVKDAQRLRANLRLLISLLDAQNEVLPLIRSTKYGQEITSLIAGYVNPSFVVDEEWMIFGLSPQVTTSYLLRKKGKLRKWKPTAEIETALAQLPKNYNSLLVTNPKRTYQIAMTWLPTYLGQLSVLPLLQANSQENTNPTDEPPTTLVDLPPSELVTQHLHENVAVGAKQKDGYQIVSRASVPLVPVLGDVRVVGVIGLYIKARLLFQDHITRMMKVGKSHQLLKKIGKALHSHHEKHDHLPTGTVPNLNLQPDERLSWMVTILPAIIEEKAPEALRLDEKWDSPQNRRVTWAHYGVYTNPAYDSSISPDDEYKEEGGTIGKTQYVGIAGWGKDATTLPVGHKRAGVFGYERKVTFSDITDGTSNTMMVSSATTEGDWAQGGKSTVRAFTQKPYFNGPDGIGSPLPKVQVLFADGSVRVLNPKMDPTIVEALSTISGGEDVPKNALD